MPAFLSGSFTFWGIVAAQGWLEQGQSSVAAGSSPESPIPEDLQGFLLSPLRATQQRTFICHRGDDAEREW